MIPSDPTHVAKKKENMAMTLPVISPEDTTHELIHARGGGLIYVKGNISKRERGIKWEVTSY